MSTQESILDFDETYHQKEYARWYNDASSREEYHRWYFEAMAKFEEFEDDYKKMVDEYHQAAKASREMLIQAHNDSITREFI